MNAFEEKFKKIHKGDLYTLLKIYWENKPIYKSQYFWIALIFSVLTLLLPSTFQISHVEILKFLSQEAVQIIPSILGFNLGGYILLISLNSSNILKDLTEPDTEKGEEFSFYQKMSSVFAFSLLLQALSLMLGIIISMVINLGAEIYITSICAKIINVSSLLLLCFILTYSIVLIGQIILNVFNFGQVLHFFIRIDNLENEDNN